MPSPRRLKNVIGLQKFSALAAEMARNELLSALSMPPSMFRDMHIAEAIKWQEWSRAASATARVAVRILED